MLTFVSTSRVSAARTASGEWHAWTAVSGVPGSSTVDHRWRNDGGGSGVAKFEFRGTPGTYKVIVSAHDAGKAPNRARSQKT